jgi:hypothetical protein
VLEVLISPARVAECSAHGIEHESLASVPVETPISVYAMTSAVKVWGLKGVRGESTQLIAHEMDGAERNGFVQGCVCGMNEKAAACIEVMRSRFEPWGGVGGMSAGRWEKSGWHVGQHDLLRMSRNARRRAVS